MVVERAAVASLRRTELGLTAAGVAVLGGGFIYLAAIGDRRVIVGIGAVVDKSWVSGVPLLLPSILLMSFILLSFAISILAPHADQHLMPPVAVLSGLGVLVAYRLGPSLGTGQALSVLMGEALCVVLLSLPLNTERLRSIAPWCAIVAPLILLLTYLLSFLPGQAVPGEGQVFRMQLQLHGLSFQPIELVKVLLIMYMADYLAAHRVLVAEAHFLLGRFQLPSVQYLLPVLVLVGLSLGLVTLQNDLGSGLVVVLLMLAMVYLATGRKIYPIIGIALFALGLAAGGDIFPTVHQRVAAWLNPSTTPAASQLVQGWIAVASGGLTGQGLGQGRPDFVPAVYTDEVLQAIGEELGLVGICAVLGLLLFVALRALYVSVRREDPFECLLAAGFGAFVGVQTLVIAGGTFRLIPLTGVPLPLISRGGSIAVVMYIMLALLLRISDREEVSR